MKKNVIKKVIGLVMAMALVIGTTAVGFATGSMVNYNETAAIWSKHDHSVHPAQMTTNGYYVAADNYQIKCPDGTCVLMDNIETTRNAANAEGVTVKAFYAYMCPECGTCNGGYRLTELVCKNCEHDCSTEKVYRFIVVPEDSKSYKSYSSVDMTIKTKSYFSSTSGEYGDGKDLPQSALKYEDGKLVGFSKAGVSIPNWRAFLQFILYPISVFLNWATNVNWGSVVLE